jgi:hypothetical protein
MIRVSACQEAEGAVRQEMMMGVLRQAFCAHRRLTFFFTPCDRLTRDLTGGYPQSGPPFSLGHQPVSIELAEEIRGFALRVRRLLPRRDDPERFGIEQDGIVRDMLHLAAQLAPRKRGAGATRIKSIESHIRINGRTVAVQRRRADFSL